MWIRYRNIYREGASPWEYVFLVGEDQVLIEEEVIWRYSDENNHGWRDIEWEETTPPITVLRKEVEKAERRSKFAENYLKEMKRQLSQRE